MKYNTKLKFGETILHYLFNIILFITLSAATILAQSGKIAGTVVDSETGEAVIGCNVIVDGTTIGAAADIDGTYLISKIPAGTYNLVFSSVGYNKKTVTDVVVKTDEVTKIDLTLAIESFETEEVVVTAKLLENNEASLLAKRQKSSSISDAISAEAISRSGSSNAADAMSKVTGASVVGGKYVYIRGLGDRYSNTQLNGTDLPSADPDKKSFNLDLFPSNLLDNLVTIKSFTPDKPGSFTGGLVDVTTKNYPEKFTFDFSTSTSYNSNTTLNSDFLTYNGGANDWLGYDDGSRDIPSTLSNPEVEIPSPNKARRDKDLALELNKYTKAFNPEMSPITETAPINQNIALSIGDQVNVLDNPFGYTASLSYSRNYKFYDNGKIGRWQLSGDVNKVNGLDDYLVLNDSKGTDEVLWGGLLNFAYKPMSNHDLNFRYLYSQSGESTARFQSGQWPNQLGDGPVYETRSLLYTERNLQTYQFGGNHFFEDALGLTVDWSAAISNTEQNEPDLRFFSDDYQLDSDTGERFYNINKNSYNEPTRFYRNLTEDNTNLNLNLSFPFKQWNSLQSKLKLGGSYTKINREFRERRFELRSSTADYNGDPTDYFTNQTGIVDSTNGRYLFGTYVFDASTLRSNYDGDQSISAMYGMIEMPLFQNLKLITGVRYETTDMNVVSQDTTSPTANLDNKDWLPSVSFIYKIDETMNVRFSYGKTLARPNFRELAPFRSFEFLGDFLFSGNANLKRSLIDNLDLRWEWFSRPGEIYAVSLFYKKFQDPIERAYNPTTELVSYQNVSSGITYGAEFEIRKRLDVIDDMLSNFMVNVNLSLIHSEVDIPTEEYETLIKPFDENADKTRPLFGQSPYIVNVELSYVNLESGTSAALLYNIFGKRLSEVTLGVTPDVYEQPRGMLDFTFSQKLLWGLGLKFSAKNILDAKIEKTIEFNGKDYIYHSYGNGRNFSVGLSYSI